MRSSSFNEMPQPPLNYVEAGTIDAISRWTRGRKPAAPVSRVISYPTLLHDVDLWACNAGVFMILSSARSSSSICFGSAKTDSSNDEDFRELILSRWLEDVSP
ncbi:hypothetical protein CISIN_1g043477mg [Citrus sinensis]|uniref:Uncharacterized protein n=1 Tax=Citrus sinensis TaxID=2711 RepID=A0A067DCE9_CITSI|nr:hypothetical protein CISIN_1g043477mg [Citrus sinensis]